MHLIPACERFPFPHIPPPLPASPPSSSQWIHSLHPDVFVLIEWAMDATAPFLQPRVRECFNFNASVLLCHDHMCASSPAPATLQQPR